MKPVLFGLAIIAMVIGIVTGGAVARLSDTETSTGNTFAAGTWIDHILINEVMYNPEFPDAQNEWVELYNPTPWDIDVGGWTIQDSSGNLPDILEGDSDHGDGSTVIPSHGYAVITDKDTQVYVNFTVPAQAVKLYVDDTAIGDSLNNSGDKLLLKTISATVADAMEWIINYVDVPGYPADGVPESESLARYHGVDENNSYTDFYIEPSPAPGAENE